MKTDIVNGSTIILGLGNPILGDDGIGCILAESVGRRLENLPNITVLSTSLSPIRLLDEIADHDRLVIIDSISTGQVEPGTLLEVDFSEQEEPFPVSGHQFSVSQLADTGKALGLSIPQHIAVYGIEIQPPTQYGDQLSPMLERRIPELSDEILELEFPDQYGSESNICREENNQNA